MSSFTRPLTVTKISKRFWRVERYFEYHVGEEESGEIIKIKQGTLTDFATTPRFLWPIFPPDGEYTQATVLHDEIYTLQGVIAPGQVYSRKRCDEIFIEAMECLKVPKWKRRLMFRAVRIFGGRYWNKKVKNRGENGTRKS